MAHKAIFLKIVLIGEKIAELEKVKYVLENILNYDHAKLWKNCLQDLNERILHIHLMSKMV